MPLNTEDMLQNRYRIVSLLGQGGMGAVYRAWDVRLNVPVALKEMIPQPGLDAATLAQLRQQFQQEATVLARLNHPNLVRVTDFFEEGGNAYLVMDFVEGESLAERIEREGGLPEGRVLEWAGQLLDALAYCHSQGIIHRDVKPQNVIIRPVGAGGGAVLVDFGLVKLWDPRDPRTKTVMRGMGTPEYAPPEQYDTVAGHTDPRSDLYSLGATLYHALTGQAPPTATQRIASRSIFQPPRALNRRVSPSTEAALLRAMELVVEDRFSTAGEMAAALGGAAPAPAPLVTPKRQPTKVMPEARAAAPPRKRVPRWVWLVGGLAVLTLLVVIPVAIAVRVLIARTGGDGHPVVQVTPTGTAAGVVVTATPRATSMPVPQFVVVPTMASPSEGLNGLFYYGFNATLPPFDSPTVRQAFALALDREALVRRAVELNPEGTYAPATTFTPPDVLGLDLYGQVGLPYDPDRARSLLAQAGYPAGSGLPPITLWYNETESGFLQQIAESVRDQWREVLGVEVSLRSQPWDEYLEMVYSDPPQVWRMGWGADYVDPHSFLHDAVCGGYNGTFYFDESAYEPAVEAIANAPDEATRRARIADFSERACAYWSPTRFQWSNAEYEALIQTALQEFDEERQRELYVRAERILCETDAVVIPLFYCHYGD